MNKSGKLGVVPLPAARGEGAHRIRVATSSAEGLRRRHIEPPHARHLAAAGADTRDRLRDQASFVHANAFHMAVAFEPIAQAIARIRAGGSEVTSMRRLDLAG